jgi:flagellar biosynthesis protein FliP
MSFGMVFICFSWKESNVDLVRADFFMSFGMIFICGCGAALNLIWFLFVLVERYQLSPL